jgi:CheY-like chemotaxis protein
MSQLRHHPPAEREEVNFQVWFTAWPGLPGYAENPTFAMTANAFGEDRQACLDAGMNVHIAKPVAPDNLFETLLKGLVSAGR